MQVGVYHCNIQNIQVEIKSKVNTIATKQLMAVVVRLPTT